MNDDLTLPASVRTVPEALAFWAERTPDAPALIVPGEPAITYGHLWRRANALAGFWHERGVGRRDRVVLLLPEGPALATALLGTAAAAIAVPLPVALTPSELHTALHGMNAAAALVTATAAAATQECFAQYAIPVFTIGDDGESVADRAQPAFRDWPHAEDLAILRQTSGTTGKPKRVPCLHGSLIANGRRHRDLFGLNRTDRAPAAAPMTSTLGQTLLMNVIVLGAAVICPPAADFARLWEAIEREGPTWMSTSSGFAELLAQHLAARPSRPPGSSLRFVQVTSGPVSVATCEVLARRLGAHILPRYSCTEAGAIAMTFPPPATGKPGSAGQPVQEVRIVGADGTELGAGHEGEIWVRGPRVVAGYLDDPEATAAAFLPGGWYRTGDTGHLDEGGFLFVTGRLNELINRGGDKIAPAEVDDVLLAHPAVRDAAAFAVTDKRLGEDIVAAVVLQPGQTVKARELRRWMLGRLSPHKVPRRIWFVETLPRTATGKVQRGVLADRFAAGQQRHSPVSS